VQIDGSGSSMANQGEGGLAFNWSTNCPNGLFDNPNSATPLLTFNPVTADNQPVSCLVFLTVFDEFSNSSCSGVVNVGNCTVDCLGQLNGSATFDRCGICNGNGQSCLGCETVDINPLQFQIDGNQKGQSRLVDQIARKILKNPDASARSKRLAKKAAADALDAYEESWLFVWSLPQISTSCSNSQFCVQSDNSQTINQIVANSASLQEILGKVVAELRKITGNASAAKQTLKQGARLDKQNIEQAGKIPVIVSACTQ